MHDTDYSSGNNIGDPADRPGTKCPVFYRGERYAIDAPRFFPVVIAGTAAAEKQTVCKAFPPRHGYASFKGASACFFTMLSEINSASRRQVLLTGSLLLSSVLALWLLPQYLAVEKPRTFHIAESGNTTTSICAPAAPFLSPEDLLDHQTYSEIDHVAGVPKLIHQSWIDRDLPIKFKQWSDSFRLKHPDWKWVSPVS